MTEILSFLKEVPTPKLALMLIFVSWMGWLIIQNIDDIEGSWKVNSKQANEKVDEHQNHSDSNFHSNLKQIKTQKKGQQ